MDERFLENRKKDLQSRDSVSSPKVEVEPPLAAGRLKIEDIRPSKGRARMPSATTNVVYRVLFYIYLTYPFLSLTLLHLLLSRIDLQTS